jgi:hypothetical protein
MAEQVVIQRHQPKNNWKIQILVRPNFLDKDQEELKIKVKVFHVKN